MSAIVQHATARGTDVGMQDVPRRTLPGQVVLVLQGGGALGAYQAGVYQALHEAGVEPDWVIGTSIGAINGALICGNAPERRLERLQEFWSRDRAARGRRSGRSFFSGLANLPANVATITQGIPAFFVPNPLAWLGAHVPLGIEAAAYYTTSPLRDDARRARRPRRSECVPHAPHRGRGQRGQRRDALFRQPRRAGAPRSRARLGRVAARVSRRCASTAARTGMAASTRTRRSRRCSTTIRAATR